MKGRTETKMSKARRVLGLAKGILYSRYAGVHRPLLVNLELTHRCNLACVFCDLARPDAPQWETAPALRIVDELARSGTQSICLNGGEPLLHPGLGLLVRRAKHHGMRVALSTNGTLITKRLEDLEGVDSLKISLDGPREVHDAVRRQPSFDRAVEGASLAARAGLQVALRMTMGRTNIAHWRDVLRIAEAIGAVALFQPAVGSIRQAGASQGSASPDVAEYRRAIAEIEGLKRRGAPIGNEETCFEYLARWPEPVPMRYCVGGRIHCAIDPEGRVHLCGRAKTGEPAPSVLELGVLEAFRRLDRRRACGECWCALTLATCYMYSLDVRMLGLGRFVRRGLNLRGSS